MFLALYRWELSAAGHTAWFRISSPARCTGLGGDLPGCCPVGTGETPTLSTLDFYMAKLHSAIESNPLQHEKLVVRIKEILSRIAR